MSRCGLYGPRWHLAVLLARPRLRRLTGVTIPLYWSDRVGPCWSPRTQRMNVRTKGRTWNGGKGAVSLAFHQGVDGEVSGRVSKFTGVVRDGKECDRDHVFSGNCAEEHPRVFPKPEEAGTASEKTEMKEICPCPLMAPSVFCAVGIIIRAVSKCGMFVYVIMSTHLCPQSLISAQPCGYVDHDWDVELPICSRFNTSPTLWHPKSVGIEVGWAWSSSGPGELSSMPKPVNNF